MFFFRILVIGVFMVLSYTSCKKDEVNSGPTGLEVQPTENLLNLISVDTFQLISTTLRVDSVRTDNPTLSSVGGYIDPVFGLFQASAATQLRLSSESIDIEGLYKVSIDSAVLNLAYSGRYGSNDKQTFEVYEITEDLSSSKAYFSNKKVQLSNQTIGKLPDFTPNPITPTTNDGSPETPSIRIPIDTNFARKLFSADQSVYSSNSSFTNFLKGIYITTLNPNQSVGEGGIIYFSLPDVYSRLIVYYTNPDGTPNELAYLINDKSISFNLSNTDYDGSEVGNVLNKTSTNSEKIYIQSLGGIMVKINTPTLKSIVKNGQVLINYARLIFSADITSTEYPALSDVFAFGLSEYGDSLYELSDKGQVHYDGSINSKGDYILGITRYVQGILDGNIENNGLLLRELGGIGARSVIYGPGAKTNPMKLEISYTPITTETK